MFGLFLNFFSCQGCLSHLFIFFFGIEKNWFGGGKNCSHLVSLSGLGEEESDNMTIQPKMSSFFF